MSDQVTIHEWHLARRPVGTPTIEDFTLVSRVLPPLEEGQIRVRNQFLSVDPYMRGRMIDTKSYVPPFELNAPLDGGAVGQVEESRHPGFSAGDTVLANQGWREAFVSDGKGVLVVDPSAAPAQSYLGVLGMPGFTAYVGLLDVGGLRAGETVLVSGAAGAVGMVACQIAKAKDCRVIGVAGSDAKTRWLAQEARVDVAINYRTTPDLRQAIGAAAPDGIDLTFENVGGPHLEAAIACSKTHGRVALCGLIAHYNDPTPTTGLRNLRLVLTKRLTIRGFIVFDHNDRRPDFQRDMAAWIGAGKMTWADTIVTGFERMPEAFIGLFSGVNLGKMVVKV
jgi:NADPH-dependent curcumin reductase CurA